MCTASPENIGNKDLTLNSYSKVIDSRRDEAVYTANYNALIVRNAIYNNDAIIDTFIKFVLIVITFELFNF